MTIELSFWGVLGTVVFVLVVGVVSGRVLGISRGFGRATAAGLLGTVVGVVVTAAVLRNGNEVSTQDVLTVGFGFSLLATMIASIVLEVLLRRRDPGRRASLRTRIRSSMTIGGRLIEVARIARRHGLAGPRLASRSVFATPEGGERVRRFLEDCGGMFVKFGQIASTRADLLPPEMVTALSHLQADVKPVPIEAVRSSLEAELKGPVEGSFTAFSDEPLAAASIGQTHLATTLDGRDVVVKVRRPDVEVGVRRDAAVLRWASRAAVRRSEAARSLRLVSVCDELIISIGKELNYLEEAAYGRALRTATATTASTGVAVPGVITGMTTEAVIVLERVHGRPVSDAAAVDACGVPRPVLAERLLRCFLSQVLDTGTFHADPHPGNILVDAEGTLWLIDFGAVGIIDPVSLQALHLLGLGLGQRDPSLIARAMRDLSGSGSSGVDTHVLESEVSRMLAGRVNSRGFDPRGLQDVVRLMDRHGIPPPPSLTLVARAMVTLEGTLRAIDPTIRLGAVAADHIGSSSELAQQSAEDVLRRELVRSLPSLRELPGLSEDIALQVRSGNLRLQLDVLAGSGRVTITDWVDQAVFAGVGAAGLLTSAVLLLGATLAGPAEDTGALTAIGYGGLVIASVMLMRVVAQIVRRQP